MALLTPTTTSRAGVALAANMTAAAGGGDTFTSTGKEVVVITNGDSGSHTVTIALQGTIDGQALASKTVTIAAGITKIIGPFDPSIYNDSATPAVTHLTYDAVTSVTIGVFKLGAI